MLSNETTIINGMVRNKNEYTKDVTISSRKIAMGGIAYRYTYEAWQRACKENYPSVQFEGDKTSCQAKPGIGEWDGIEGVVYTKDSKTKDESYKGYLIKEQDGKFKVYESGMNSLINTFSSLQEAKDFLDLHGNQELAKDGTGAFASGELKKADKKLHKPLVSVGKN